jgi:hypothetical protein
MLNDLIRRDEAILVAMSIHEAMKKKGMVGQSNGARKVADALAALTPTAVDASRGADADGKVGAS